MTKVLKKLNYVENLMTFISRMQDSNWVDEGEPVPPGPTPSTLTPFSVGQYITGFDFGDVQNGDRSVELEEYLANIEYNDGITHIVEVNTNADLVAYKQPFEETYIYALACGEIMLYCTMAYEEVAQGFNNLTNGKYDFSSVFEASEVTGINQAAGWNGVLIGAVEGEGPVSSLTPFKNTDLPYNVSKIVVDLTAMSSDELMNFYNKFKNTTVFVGREDAGAPYIAIDKEDMKGLLIMSATSGGMLVFICEAVESFEVGCWYKDEGGQPVKVEELEVMELDNENNYVGYVNNDAWSDFGDINGILVGYIPGEEPEESSEDSGSEEPTISLSPIQDNVSVTTLSDLGVNIGAGVDEINAWITDNKISEDTNLVQLDVEGTTHELLSIENIDGEGTMIINIAGLPLWYSKSYSETDKDTGETTTYEAGWQYDVDIEGETLHLIDSTTGAINSTLLSEMIDNYNTATTVVNNELTGWNGTFIGLTK